MLIQLLSLFFLLLLPLNAEVRAQSNGRSVLDSAEIRKQAERLQRNFERTRWQHLPWTYGSSGRCDIRIGQYCFTFDDNDWDPPPDNPEVVAAREDLVRALDSLHTALPQDDWIVTQLVRYSVELGRFDLAQRAASRCMHTQNWLCPALAGFAHHVAGEYAAAENAFENSLRQMTVQQRCEWEDLSELITGKLRGEWRARECDSRVGLLDTLFWLSDPMYFIPGNELRTEHFARHVASTMYRQARGPDLERWSPVAHKIIMRYGWPMGWERRREFRASLRPPVVTHYGTDGSGSFLPDYDIVRDPMSTSDDDWDIDPDRPQSSHSPLYAHEAFERLHVNWAMFRRGDSTAVVYIVSLGHDRITASDSIAFAVAVSSGPHTLPKIWSDTVSDTIQILTSTSRASRQLVSVEAVAHRAGVAGRARFGLDLGRLHRPGLVASDVLVLESADTLPTSLGDALVLLRRPRDYEPGERFILYWEMYGVQVDLAYSTTVSLDKTSKGIFRRIAEVTPFASHQPAVHVAWEDAAQDPNQPVARSLSIDLPAELSDGQYRLTLKIQDTTGEHIERTVDFTVRSRS